MAHALNRHLVLVGFMGAGKTTVGEQVARRLGRPFLDVDRAIENAHGEIWDLFAQEGESAFRELEARFVRDACGPGEPSVIAVGGGAVETRRLLENMDAHVVHVDVDVVTAWERVQGSRRPLAQDEAEFRRRFDLRAPLYAEVAAARAHDAEGLVLAAAGIRFAPHAEVHGDAVVADAHVAELHGIAATHLVPAGEAAKSVAEAERLWRALELDRGSTLVAVGGGSTTDVAGFVAATYMRGIEWIPVPSTLVGQVDAAIGGKVGIDVPEGKNLVGAFHWPKETVVDTALLATLPEDERLNGLAEVVKTGLLAGEPLWELDLEEQVRRCAAFKAASARSSTSGTRSRTRSRRPPGIASRTAAPSHSVSSLRFACRASTTTLARWKSSCRRRRSPSAATPRGLRSDATRRPGTAASGSSCSSRPAGRA
jgi:shikimate kinase